VSNPKKKSRFRLILLVVAIVVIAAIASRDKDQSSTSGGTEANTPPPPAFVAERETACENYRGAVNEVAASEIHNAYLEAAEQAGYSLEGVQGTVDEIRTTHAGGRIFLEIETSFGTVSNSTIMPNDRYDIEDNDPLHDVIVSLPEGATVRFSGDRVMPMDNPISERSTMCDDEWLIHYTSLE